MMKQICTVIVLLALALAANAQAPRHGIRTGTVQQVDEHAKSVTIKSDDGTEHTLQIEARTKFHGVHGNSRNTTDKIQGLKPGAQLAAHYTAAGTAENAVEIDNIGADGLKTIEATITHLDRGEKTLTVQNPDGSNQTFHMSDSTARYAAEQFDQGSANSLKVILYYSGHKEGHPVAHYFKKAM
jgi:Cu/Ag efflux protein CusF